MTEAARTARNPPWTRDEVILACDLVVNNGGRYLDVSRPEVVALSGVLRSLGVHPGAEVNDTFRNPNGVARKTADIATQHPDYTGKPTRGGSHDRQVLLEFLRDPAGMAALAVALRAAAGDALTRVQPVDLDVTHHADEGALLERRHLVRERDPRLRAKKLAQTVESGRSIACDICGFDFEQTYGERGHGYIEVHHRVPLHVSGTTRTNLVDLALVCSNCHRMIHRSSPWLTVEQLASRTRSVYGG